MPLSRREFISSRTTTLARAALAGSGTGAANATAQRLQEGSTVPTGLSS